MQPAPRRRRRWPWAVGAVVKEDDHSDAQDRGHFLSAVPAEPRTGETDANGEGGKRQRQLEEGECGEREIGHVPERERIQIRMLR